MKKSILLLMMFIYSLSVYGQEKKISIYTATDKITKKETMGLGDSPFTKWIIPPDYDKVELLFPTNHYYKVTLNAKEGLFDKTGKIIFPPNYDHIYLLINTEDRYFSVTRNGMVGILDKDGNEILPFDYSYVSSWGVKNLNVKVGKKINGRTLYGLYNIEQGKMLIPCIYDVITDDNTSCAIEMPDDVYRVGRVQDDKWSYGLFNIATGKEVVPRIYTYIYWINGTDNFIAIKDGVWPQGSAYEYLEEYAEEVKKETGNYPCVESLWNMAPYIGFYPEGGLWGILDKDGKELTPCIYGSINPIGSYNESIRIGGLVQIGLDGKWGYVDIITGKIAIPVKYDEAHDFENGVARVTWNGEVMLIKNPLKEGNAIALAEVPATRKGPNAPAVSLYPAPNSDVDKDIPQVKDNNENLFAFIIANENYPEAPVPYALNDGRIFKEYCLKTLGAPNNNVKVFEDATLGRIIGAVEQIKEIADVYNGDAEVIVYYAGHGVPDDKRNTAYLLPIDGNGSDIIHTGYSLEKLYAELGKLKLKTVTVFLDACFSGAKREDEMLISGRGVAIKVKEEAPQGNMVVFSAAQGDETAHQYEEKGHGLFTYFLLKKLQETRGDVTYGELSDYMNKQVKRLSVVINNKRQTPTVLSSSILADKWQEIKLK